MHYNAVSLFCRNVNSNINNSVFFFLGGGGGWGRCNVILKKVVSNYEMIHPTQLNLLQN